MLDSTDDYCIIAFSAVAAGVAQPLAMQCVFTKTKAFYFAICWVCLQIRKADHRRKAFLNNSDFAEQVATTSQNYSL